LNWYVVYTKPRWEKKVAANLSEKGIENYCPLNRVTRQWSDRKKVVLEPLFKGYVFVAQNVPDIIEIKKTDGILNFVYRNGKPGVVREEEMNTIRKFLDEFSDVTVTDLGTSVSDTVLIKQGLLMNHKGIVLELNGSKAKVRIDSMGVQLTAVFERKNIVKV
jgi:transcription antitermination factor NusG